MANQSYDWKGAIRIKDTGHTTNNSYRYKGAIQLQAAAAATTSTVPNKDITVSPEAPVSLRSLISLIPDL